MKANKIFFLGMGVVIALAGVSTYNADLTYVTNAVLLFIGALILLSLVSWQKLRDRKTDFNDVTGVVGLLLAGFAIVSGIFILLQETIPSWIALPTTIGMVAIGIVTIFIAFKNN